ncbi:MAG: MFS transporter [Pseudomonadota bacterium]
MPTSRIADRAPIALLAIGQTFAWAGLYYLFAALFLTWEGDLGWTKPQLTLALTLAVLASALAAPIAGRLIEAGKGPLLLGLSTALGGMLVALLPTAGRLMEFYLFWVLIGLCQAGALYEPCFALVSRARGTGARGAITTITLVAGLASTFAFAGGAALTALHDWRFAAWCFALVTCLVAAPASYIGARMVEARSIPTAATPDKAATIREAPRRKRTIGLLALAFPMIALNHGILLTHLLPLLDDRAIAPATAILAASLIGPMQVAGRLAMTLFAANTASLTLTLLAFAGTASAAGILLLGHQMPTLIFVAVAVQGAAYGLISIMKPVVVTELLGRKGIAGVLSWLALPYLAGFAIAPFLGALIWQVGGYDLVLVATAGFALIGMLAIGFAARTVA